MRFLEVALLVGLALLLLRLALPWRWARLLPGWLWVVVALIAWLHTRVDGTRWQMWPAYGVFVGVSLVQLRRLVPAWRRRPIRPRWRAGLLALAGLGTLLSGLAATLFPVPNLPAPSGVYQVGTFSMALRDASRDEIYTADPNDKRELMIQLWYPATPQLQARPAPWMERMDVVGPIIAQWLRLPPFLLSHAGLVRSNSYPDAPLSEAEARYPVILYSHGWGGFRNINANQNEDLASHGYIVVSVDHPYGGLVTLFSDGRVVLNKRDILPDMASPNYAAASQGLEEVFSQDEMFVLSELERLNQTDARLQGRLDLSHIGLFGHSTGGGSVIKTCARDARCVAGVGLDAWVEPVPDDVIKRGLRQPFLFMRSETWAGPQSKNDVRLSQLIQNSVPPHDRLSIVGVRHYDFVMVGLLSPLASSMNLKGPINTQRALRLVDDYLIAFFDIRLKGRGNGDLQALSSRYPEVRFDVP